jgi:hypothetical protein
MLDLFALSLPGTQHAVLPIALPEQACLAQDALQVDLAAVVYAGGDNLPPPKPK